MSSEKFDLNGALARAEAEIARRFPEFAGIDGRTAERRLVLEGKITEAALVELYSNAFGVPVLEEDEIVLPEMHEEFSLAFFNAHDCIVLEFNGDIHSVDHFAGSAISCHTLYH